MSKLIRLIYVLFAASMLIFIFLSINYIRQVKKLEGNIRKVDYANRVLLVVEQVNGNLNDNGARLRDMIILKNEKALPAVLQGNMALLSRSDNLVQLTVGDSDQHEKARRMKTVLSRRFKLIRDSIPLYASTEEEISQFVSSLNSIRQEYDSIYTLMRDAQTRNLSLDIKTKDRFDKLTTPVLTILLTFTTLFILATFFYLVMTLKKRIYFQNELQTKIETLNMANKELENLSRVTSHHIQEPMRKIRNFSTMLDKRLGQLTEEEISQIVMKIESNAGSLQVLAQNLVQYANLIQDQRPKEKTDLNEVLDEVIFRLDDLIFETKAEIKRSGLPVVQAIPYQIFILLQELIRNSIFFCKPDHSPLIEVYQLPAVKNDRIVIAVKDYGVGFSNDFAERIFRMFEQLEPRSAPGKGIGLAMCSRIMLNHGGKIWAEGQPGLGAVFFMEFPGTAE